MKVLQRECLMVSTPWNFTTHNRLCVHRESPWPKKLKHKSHEIHESNQIDIPTIPHVWRRRIAAPRSIRRAGANRQRLDAIFPVERLQRLFPKHALLDL